MKNHILFATIAALAAPCYHAAPQPAYGDIDPADVQEFAAKDQNRLTGQTVRALIQKSPYVDVLEGGTMEANMSDEQRVVIQERAVLNQSLVRPTFTLDKNMCGQTGPEAEVGSTEYTFELSTNRGRGPLVCIKGMWAAFKTAYSAAEGSLKGQLVQLNNSDVRITLVDRSGCKAVCRTSNTFSALFEGNIQSIDTHWPTRTLSAAPDAELTFKFLKYIGRFLREDLLVDPWEGKQGEPVLRFIGSQQIIDKLRDEADVKSDLRYVTAGSYDVQGMKPLTRYLWEGSYQGFTFGVDPQPLRFSQLDGSGDPLFIEPEVAYGADNGAVSRPNPLWVHAKYEVGLLVGMNSFRKLAPETNTGEGSFKFPAQGITGQLMWHNIADNDKNVWQDFGRHFYQFTRAYKPERPHAVCPIAFARSQADFGFSAITSYGDWSATGSL